MARPPPPSGGPGVLTVSPPPPDLAAIAAGFVRRIDPGCGGVVRILPDARVSLQVQAADPYWVREQGPDAPWRPVPRVALWGPRHRWGWGYARRDISAFAVQLTPSGFAALARQPPGELIDDVRPVGHVDPALAAALGASPDEPFEDWIGRAAAALRAALSGRPPAPDPTAPSLPILAVEEGDVTARAAAACGLSKRHYRRVFRQLHGTSPKLYQRLLRVDRRLRELHARPWEADPWTDAPIPFADQPHEIREFRALTGLTPRAYLRAKRAGDATLRSVAGDPAAPPPPDDAAP